MTTHLLSLIFGFLVPVQLEAAVTKDGVDDNCSAQQHSEIIGGIGGVIDQKSRVGKEQKIAMELAVKDFHQSTCSRLVLHLKDSHGGAASAAISLTQGRQVQVIMGTLTPQDAALVSEVGKVTTEGNTIIFIATTPTSSPTLLPGLSSLIQISNDIATRMRCIAAIVGHFGWRKVIALHEDSNSFSSDSGIIMQLSDELQVVGAVIEHRSACPPISSLLNPRNFVDKELKKLRRKNNRVFILVNSSPQFAVLLFKRAKQIGMMGKGYVWIVSDDFSSLLDSIPQPVISNMQGVIGFKLNFTDTSESFRSFKLRFQRKFRSEYPEEEEHSNPSNPSIYALRAYDATWAIARAMQSSKGKFASTKLLENFLASNYTGLSGIMSFKNGKLAQLPTFQIINVIGKSYREIALWSPKYGLVGDLGSIYWPGGEKNVPKGWTLRNKEKPLKIGVPARAAFHHFVKVSYDHDRNETYVTGLTIEIFQKVVNELPYQLPYVLVPYNGSYDEMVAEVHNKSLDAAVGDISITADRYEIAEFSQPYMESGLVMVVTVKPEATNENFMFVKAFSMEMWLLMALMSVFTGFVVWITENVENNPEFAGSSVFHHVGRMLWFSVTVLSFAQRETIKSNLSRFILSVWLFVVVVVTAGFTAILTSMVTAQRQQPSVVSIEYLQRTNAAVGCNGNSFIVQHLVNVLHFKPEIIRKIDSIEHYPEAFKSGEIAAAFLVAPHAKVFLAEYCQGFTRAGPSLKLGGFGFVFPKGSLLAIDISEAILEVSESGKILELEKHMLSLSNCSSSTDPSLGPRPFSGLFIVSGCISAAALLISTARLLKRHSLILRCTQAVILLHSRVSTWAFSL